MVNAVKQMKEVPQDIKTVMTRALKGALDFVLNDIHPEGQEYIDFFFLIPRFQQSVGELLKEDLKHLDFATKPLIEEVLDVVGN